MRANESVAVRNWRNEKNGVGAGAVALPDMLKSMSLARMGAAIGLTIAVAGFFMYVMGAMTEAPKALLFSGLDGRDSAEIVARLDNLKVPYSVEGDGSTVLVAADQVLRLRMQLAGEGLPAGGSVGYEIFDRSDSFGQTNFVQNINLVRALEGELGRTVRSLTSIANARVHLNIPKRELFAQKQPEPTASVVIRSRGTVSPSQVQAIQNLVASAVPGMTAGAVTVIDEKGTMLGGGASSGASSSNEDRTEETINYEVSKTKSVEIQEGGRIKRLSVAVAVDGAYTADDKGTRTYAPRAAEEMQQIEQLVRSAIGFDEKRGDQLKVVNLRFNQPEIEELPPVEEPLLGMNKNDWWRASQFGGLGLIALLMIFFVMRPLIKALVSPMPATTLASQAIAGPAPAAALTGAAASAALAAAGAAGALPPPQSVVQAMIDIAQVEGQVKESSVRKVGEIVGKHPDEATAILRQWLHESA
jgi:flagellar biosynthesis/type III secretory pathway M-ring protein FliF/YscJ